MSVCHTVIPEKVYDKEIQYHAASPGKKPLRAEIFFGICLFICDLFASAYIALDDKIKNNEMGGAWKDAIVAQFEICPIILLVGLRKT
jgi:hypothetical protein